MHEIVFDGPVTDTRPLRQALGRFATGVTVITTVSRSGKTEGLTCNSFAAVSLDPPLVLWSLRNDAASVQSFTDAEHFAVSVLASDQSAISNHFATRHEDKFGMIDHQRGHGDCPVIVNALASFECKIHSVHQGGDHLVFFGQVLRATYRDGEPLLFAGGTYCKPVPLVPKV